MEPRIIVTTQKPGKQPQHTIHRAMAHDPQPQLGKRFGRLGIVLAIRPIAEPCICVSCLPNRCASDCQAAGCQKGN